MTTANGPQPVEKETEKLPPSVAGDDSAPESRDAVGSRLRRFGRVWLIVAIIEAVLYVLVYRSATLSDLYPTPALLVLAGGAYGTWHALRPRTRQDRRHGDRRHSARRE